MGTTSVDSLYEQALKLSEKLPATAGNISRVASQTSDAAAQWAFSQWSLRKRGLTKFERAMEMLFDRDGLEMATHEQIARYHASQYPGGVEVVDLTAGIGADLIALASRGPAVGFESDPERAEMAGHNLAVHGVEAELLEQDSLSPLTSTSSPQSKPQTPNSKLDYWLADPARRHSKGRTLDPTQFAPNPIEIVDCFGDCKLGVLKLSPMLPDSFLESFGGRLEFVSLGGECREALVVLGSKAGSGRFAVRVEDGARLEATDDWAPSADAPGTYLYEADAAAIRAHCLPALASEHGIEHLADSNGYLTGNQTVESPWLTCHEVLDTGRGDVKEIRKQLEGLGSATPVLKQRGTKLDLQRLEKSLKMRGSQKLAVAFYQVGPSLRHSILHRNP